VKNKNNIKLTIVTVNYNNGQFIADCFDSVLRQEINFPIEHIIVDGVSTDNSLRIIKEYEKKYQQKNITYRWISEKDNGLYDAMNKGIKAANGEIIGILNADDVYVDDNLIQGVIREFTIQKVDTIYGDIKYVARDNLNKDIRIWKSGRYRPGIFRYGWMPPHPTFFVKKSIYKKHGYFNTDLPLAADYEIMLRFLEKHKISTHYLEKVFVKMRAGGTSNRSFQHMLQNHIENKKAWKLNGMHQRWYTSVLKRIVKLNQFILAFKHRKDNTARTRH